ncbi:MAG: hypothetical protein AB8D52_03230 [Gammaproteobacteria bacterium]
MDITIIISGNLILDYQSETTSLSKMITCGNTEFSDQNLLELLFGFFGIKTDLKADLPVAAITAQVDLADSSDQNLLRADPVIMKADMTSLRLFDSQYFSLESEVMLKIISRLNALLEEDNLKITCGENPHRWYIGLKKSPAIITSSPGDANGQDAREFLPRGDDSKFWIRLMNEIQMILFDISNQEDQENLPINSLWFWGAGEVPDLKNCLFDSVLSNDVNAAGLAKRAKIPCYSIAENFQENLDQCKDDKKILIVLSQGDIAISSFDPFKQVTWLGEMESNIFHPIFRLVKKRKIKHLKIISEDQYCSLKPIHLYRFWHKKI